MRVFFAAGLTGLALISLAACNQPGPAANATSPALGAPGAQAASGPLTADQFPHRRAGLWRQVTSMDGAASGPGTQMCVDDASEARMQAFDRHTPGVQCSAPQLVRNMDGSINVSLSCDMGPNGKIVTTGIIRGDFNSSYTYDTDTQISGSSMAKLNGDHKMTITGTWTGPCAPGQQGGDIILPNGQTHNILSDQSSPANATH